MSTRRKEILREFGARPSLESRKAMASRIVALEMQLSRVKSVTRVVMDTGFSKEVVIFAADLDKALEGKP
jgi:hypothetical protein